MDYCTPAPANLPRIHGRGIPLLLGLVILGLPIGTIVALNSGGTSAIMHYSLRYSLVRNGLTPWNYVRFLDYCAERILLRKVGGGYAFIHRMLLDYFAARYVEASIGAEKPTRPSSIDREL